ncbi:DJ-1/PfpI family protein [Euzebya tangerina]|uniref:DJ-1/PfpI family protein n=1 Tax=Euzebya tangerina TaxID=591198 RepID=UPI00196ACD6D|nr:DJ-1/PfpI family protein [Euzebya tangerina]
MVLATEAKNMTMANGEQFSTGNHPVELFVPLLHLRNAGFDVEIVTPTGEPVALEMWAFPTEDAAVSAIRNELEPDFEQPRRLVDVVAESFDEPGRYAAVFVPGGHGAMLGLPTDPNVGALLRWAHDNGAFTISICHGPAALLATALGGNEFLYEGYDMAVFPHVVDRQTPRIGYMPGHMPWPLSDTLEQSGARIVNTKADETVHVDRGLITGASPRAANALGELAATTLLDDARTSGW